MNRKKRQRTDGTNTQIDYRLKPNRINSITYKWL